MVTSKEEALAHLSDKHKREAQALRDRIEKALEDYGGGVVTVAVGESAKAMKLVIAEYEAVGWTVDFGDDQRDVAWMTLR